MEAQRLNLFSTPVGFYEGFLPPDLAQNISDHILKMCTIEVDIHGALLGDAYSSHKFEDNTNILQSIADIVPGCSKIIENLTKCIDDFTVYNNYPKGNIENNWFNVQKPGSILQRHMHIGGRSLSIASGALYINVDEKSSPLIFENPNPYSIFFEPKFDIRTFQPKVGDLIIFPSWLPHYTKVPNMTENRIVISFNVG